MSVAVANSNELVNAIKRLTMTLEGRTNESKKKGSFIGTLMGNNPLVQTFKDLKKPGGVIGAIAARSGNGIMGQLLGTAAEVRAKRGEEVADKQKWIAAHLTGTDTGRKMLQDKGEKSAKKEAAGLYDQLKDRESRIDRLEQKRKNLKNSGHAGADLSDDDNFLINFHKKKRDQLLGLKTDEPKKRETPVIPSPEKPVPETYPQGLPELMNNQDFQQGVYEGVQEELLKLNEEQLAQLKKLVQSSISSEEDKYEAKKQATSPTGTPEKKEAKKATSFMDDVINQMKDIPKMFSEFGSTLKGVIPMVASLASVLGPVLAVAGAGAAGYAAGKYINDEYMTNKDGSSKVAVGAERYREKFKSFFGMETDEEKTKRVDQENKLALGNKLLSEGKSVSKDMADTLKEAGVTVPREKIVIPGKVPYRETAQVAAENAKESSTKKEETPKTSQVQNNTVVNNNSSTVYQSRPVVRTPEPTFNRLLASSVAF